MPKIWFSGSSLSTTPMLPMKRRGLPFVRASYNGNMRKNYAGIGYVYDAGREAFIAPQPFASWALNEATCCWQAPVPHPEDGKPYSWDEARQAWQPRAKDELKQDADLK
jgi:hypothetical protein